MQSSSCPPSPLALSTKPRTASMVSKLVHIVDQFNAILLFILSIGLGILTCLGFVQVLWRYMLNEPLVWTEEIIRYALIWTIFLGAGIVVKKGQLVAVELFVQLAPATLRKVLLGSSLAICGIFWAILLVYGVIVLGAVEGMKSGALEMPMPFVYLAIPVGAAIALINTLAVAFDLPQPSLDGLID